MNTTPDPETLRPAHPELTLRRIVSLGLRGIASDVRDRRRHPALRKPATPQALRTRLDHPIFIIGAPRSGTSFLGSCIGLIPEVSYHFEPRLTKAAARCVYDGSWSEEHAERVFRTSYGMLLLATLEGGRRFAEKNPENGFVVPFLGRAFPNARFVHIIRDGRDAAVSHAEQPWLQADSNGTGRQGRGGQRWGNQPRWWVEEERRAEFTQVTDLVRAAWCWRRFTEAAMEGVATLPPQRRIEVRYEVLVNNPGLVAAKLARFLEVGEDSQRALADGLAAARPASMERWRSELTEPEIAAVEAEIGGLLAKLGYA